MKILIVSDTHGYHGMFDKALSTENPVDMLLHTGDVEGGDDYMAAMADCDVYMVRGNNDFFSDLPAERELLLCGRRLFMCHGHNYGVSLGADNIYREGKSRGADIVLYGHTHYPHCEERDGIWLINPGSLSCPRQPGRKPSYAVLDLSDDGHIQCRIEYL